MMTWKIRATCLLLTFLCLFTTVGYAAVSSDLWVSGVAKNDVPLGLFITSVTRQGSAKADHESATYIDHSKPLTV